MEIVDVHDFGFDTGFVLFSCKRMRSQRVVAPVEDLLCLFCEVGMKLVGFQSSFQRKVLGTFRGSLSCQGDFLNGKRNSPESGAQYRTPSDLAGKKLFDDDAEQGSRICRGIGTGKDGGGIGGNDG